MDFDYLRSMLCVLFLFRCVVVLFFSIETLKVVMCSGGVGEIAMTIVISMPQILSRVLLRYFSEILLAFHLFIRSLK